MGGGHAGWSAAGGEPATGGLVAADPLPAGSGRAADLPDPQTDDLVDFEIRSREPGDGDSEEVERAHAQGKISYQSTSAKNWQPLDLTEIRSAALREEDKNAFYAALAGHGLAYGETLQTVQRLWLGTNEVLSELDLPPGLVGDSSDYFLHPALLDGALQSAAALLSQEAGVFLPFGLDEVACSGPLPNHCFGTSPGMAR